MKIFALVLVFCVLLVPLVSADACEYNEIHECRFFDDKMHAFNGQLDTDCVERGIYEICTAFDYLGAEGSCFIDTDNVSKCACVSDVELFCSSDLLSIVVSNPDCTTKNIACDGGLLCSQNEDAPFNPVCGTSAPPADGGTSGGGGGGGSIIPSEGGDFPTPKTPEPDAEEEPKTLTTIIEDITLPVAESISKPENLPYTVLIIIIVVVVIAGAVYYLKFKRKKKYKGY
ncbi:MAG: hypothetical protein ABIF08_01790 [Nanoarchaeota archaeon]